MIRPVRLKLRRTRGFRLQEVSLATNGLPARKVDRSTRFGNPWAVGDCGIPDAAEAARRFRAAVIGFKSNGAWCGPKAHPDSYIGRIIRTAPAELAGHNLACWCDPDAPCHADVLLDLANREPAQ